MFVLFCKKCGSQVNQNENACAVCGEITNKQPQQPAQQQFQPQSQPQPQQQQFPPQFQPQQQQFQPQQQFDPQQQFQPQYQTQGQMQGQMQGQPPFPQQFPAQRGSVLKKKKSLITIAVAIVAVIIAYNLFFGNTISAGSVNQTLKSFETAINKGEMIKMMDLFNPNSSNIRWTKEMLTIAKKESPAEYKMYADEMKSMNMKIKVNSVEYNGDTAYADVTVTYTENGRRMTDEDTITLFRVDGKWYISERYLPF
jgi:uncharacterized membrane protein YvbJ